MEYESDGLWKQKTAPVPNSNRKEIYWTMTEDGDDGDNWGMTWALNEYCSNAREFCYVKVHAEQVSLLGLSKIGDVYVSKRFIEHAAAGNYGWHCSRTNRANEFFSDGIALKDVTFKKYFKIVDSGGRLDQNTPADQRKYNMKCVKGHYLMPLRDGKGLSSMVEISDKTLSYLYQSFWDKVMKKGSTVPEERNYALLRAYNPAKETMKLKIRPCSHSNDITGSYTATPQHGIMWDDVVAAFKDVMRDNVTIDDIYTHEEPGPDDIKLYSNPFYHYETWISTTDMARYISTHPDRPYLRRDKADQLYKEKSLRMEKQGNKEGDFNITDPKHKNKIGEFTENMEGCIIGLDSERIFAAVGKRKGVKNQGQVTGESAPDIAARYFKWNKNDKGECTYIAEWLHLAGFAFGGIQGGNDAWFSSQNQLNLVLGTAETNSIMLRYETAWQYFFRKEYAIREQLANAGYGTFVSPKGTLQIDCNKYCNVRNFEIQDGQLVSNVVKFDEVEDMVYIWEHNPWICYTMVYFISIDEPSFLLDWQQPGFAIDFYPFTRLFYTKGEMIVDLKLLDLAYERKLKLLKPAVYSFMAPQTFTLANNTQIFKFGDEENAVQVEEVKFLDTEDEEVMVEANDSLLNTSESIVLNDAAPAEESEMPPESDKEADFSTADPMVDFEKRLTEEVEFEEINMFDNLISIDNLEFRNTLESVKDSTFVQNDESLEEFNGEGLSKLINFTDTSPQISVESLPESLPHVAQDDEVIVVVEDEPLVWKPMEKSYLHAQSAPEPLTLEENRILPAEANIIVVGGVPLLNPQIVVAQDLNTFADIPVTVRTADVVQTQSALLLHPIDAPKSAGPEPASMVLLLAPEPRFDMTVEGPVLESAKAVKTELATGNKKIGTMKLPSYVMKGDVPRLFGIPGIKAELYVRQSDSADVPVYEKATPILSNAVGGAMGKLFPNIPSEALSLLPVEKSAFIYSEDENDILHPPGLRFEADIPFKDSLQPVGDILKELFSAFGSNNTPPTAAHISAHLSRHRDWAAIPPMTEICLQGSFENIDLWIADVINFKQMGLEISSSLVTGIGESRWRFGYGFFGTLEIHKIQKTHPIVAKYRMQKKGRLYRLAMQLTSEEWTSVFGIENFDITNVQLNTSFSTKSVGNSLNIQLSAFMTLGDAKIRLAGQYSKAESYLEAEVGNLTPDELRRIYVQFTGNPVSVDLEGNSLVFEQLYVKISTKGVELRGKVTFNEYSSAEARIKVGSAGLEISGSIENFKIPMVEIKKASLDILIGAHSETGRKSRFAISGEIDFEGQKITAGFYTSKNGSGAEREWMVYGAFDGDLRLSDLCKSFKGKDLDIALKSAAVIASNIDKKSGSMADENGSINALNYPISKGIQLCAVIDPFPAIKNAAKSDKVDGLVIILSYDMSNKLVISIRLPSSMTIRMGETASIKDFAFGLEISSAPKLILSGVLEMKMKDQDPLLLLCGITAGIDAAGGFLRTQSEWKNPFGLSEKVIVKSLGFDIEFAYATVAVSGPSKFGIDGIIMVGTVKAQATMSVGQRPDSQCLILNISKINIADLIKFIGDITDNNKLKTLEAGDFLKFKDAGMYFSTGATIATIKYDAGMSAAGTMTLFGKEASFKASVSKKGIEFAGKVNAFKIGPLEVKSASGAPDASMDITMTTDEQKYFIDGWIILYALNVKMYINISLQPIVFDVNINIELAGAFKFLLKAKAENVSDVKDLSKANLLFEAELEADIIGAVCDAVLNALSHVEELGDAGFAAVNQSLSAKIVENEQNSAALRKKLVQEEARFEQSRKDNLSKLTQEKRRLSEAQNTLDALKDKLKQAEGMKQRDIEEARQKLQAAEAEKAAAAIKKRQEYQQQLTSEESNLKRLQGEQEQLKSQQGMYKTELEKTLAAALKYDVENQLVKSYDRKLLTKVEELQRANPISRVGIAYDLARLKGEQILIQNGFDLARKAYDGTNKDRTANGLKQLGERVIQSLTDVNIAQRSFQSLITNGPEGFIRKVLEENNKKVEDANRELDVAINGKSNTIRVIREAKEALDKNEPDLLLVIADADAKIKEAQAKEKLDNLKAVTQTEDEREVALKKENEELRASLQLVQKDFKKGVGDLKDVVKQIEDTTFRITKIEVKANARDLVEGKDMVFMIECVKNGKQFTVEERWSPLKGVVEFYRGIAKKAISL